MATQSKSTRKQTNTIQDQIVLDNLLNFIRVHHKYYLDQKASNYILLSDNKNGTVYITISEAYQELPFPSGLIGMTDIGIEDSTNIEVPYTIFTTQNAANYEKQMELRRYSIYVGLCKLFKLQPFDQTKFNELSK
jgi:hypothetical protein